MSKNWKIYKRTNTNRFTVCAHCEKPIKAKEIHQYYNGEDGGDEERVHNGCFPAFLSLQVTSKKQIDAFRKASE